MSKTRIDKTPLYRLSDSIPYVMYRIVNKLNQNIHERLRRSVGITLSTWRLLSSLKSRGTCTVGELAACTVMRPAVVSRILTQMEKQGLVRRRQSKADHRVVQITLTHKGERLFQAAFTIAGQHRDDALRGLSASDTASLLAMLRTLQRNIGIEP